jgi:hypothetical protein
VPYLSYGIRGYVDLPALALVVWAAALEARRPRRGTAVLVLLTLAGLLRPEAWLLAGAYWLWAAPRVRPAARAGLAALAVAAPLIWALGDLLVTGDPLWSFTGTSGNAARLERPTGLTAVPEVLPFRLGEILRLPELLAAVVGFAGGLAWLGARVALPVAVAALNGVVYLLFAIAGLPLLGRYLFVAAAMLALLAALAGFGWRALPAGHRRRRAALYVGVTVLAVLVAFAPVQAGRLADLRGDIARRAAVQDDLRELVRRPAAVAALRGGGVLYAPTHRPLPMLAYWTDRPPRTVRSAALERPGPRDLYVEPLDLERARLSTLDPRDPTPASPGPPAGYREIARNRSWRMLGTATSATAAQNASTTAPSNCDPAQRRSSATATSTSRAGW